MNLEGSTLRVLHITPTGQIGGREKQLFELMCEMEARNCQINDVFIVRPEGPYWALMQKLRIRVHANRYSRWNWRFWRNAYALFKTYDIINFWGADFSLFLISLLTNETRAYTLTGTRFLTKRDLGLDATDHMPSRERRTWRHIAGVLRLFLKRKLFSLFLKHCRLIITPSQFMRDLATREYHLLPSRIVVIPNFLNYSKIGIARSRLDVRYELGLKEDDFVVGVVARFDRRKRLDRFIRAISIANRSANIRAILVGDGSPNDRMWVQGCLQLEEASAFCIQTGFRRDVYDLMNAMDAIVLPSDCEAFGIVLLESLYLQVPTIVFRDGGGVHETIKEGETGFIVETVDDLAGLLVRMSVDKGTFDRHVGHAKDYVVDHFCTDHAESYVRTFSRVVDDKRPWK